MIGTKQIIEKILIEILFEDTIYESQKDYYIISLFYNSLLESKLLYGEPLSIEELRKLLRQKILNFEFVKLDGSVRPARGTTMLKYIPQQNHPKGIRPSSPKVATFFDLEKKDWRSVSQRSKEIVIKKDEEKNRPIIVVSDIGAKKSKEEEQKAKYDKKIAKSRDTVRVGPEPEDELEVGDIRNYLNRNNKNVIIEITKMNDDGSLYATTYNEKIPFYIPSNKIVNIGEVVPPEDLPEEEKEIPLPFNMQKKEEKPIVLKPVTPKTPENVTNKLIKTIIPQEETPEENLENRDDAEELIK